MGRASALALAAAGAQVLVHYSRGPAEAAGVVNEIRKAGGRADAIAADLAAPDGAHKLANRSVISSAIGWISSSRTRASPRLRQSRTPRSKILTISSPLTFTPALFRPPFRRKARNAHVTTPEQNKALVLQAFDTLFNKRDYEAASCFGSDKYIQRSAHIEPGREGLFRLIRSLSETPALRAQHHSRGGRLRHRQGRFSGTGRPAAWVAADVVRIEDGVLAEHWDVLQDEATRA
jgi:predicted SnoaL-like aldol condensation-catalyzing enzyme